MKFFKLTFLLILFLTFATLNAQQWGAYTLYSVQNTASAVLVDTNGTNYHTWTFASNAKTGYSSYLLPGGTLLRTVARSGNSFNGGGMCGQIQKVDWNSTVLWSFVYSTSTYCSHHDICPMPNGNVLLISYESKTAAQTSQAGCSQSITMWPDKIVEVHQTGATTGEVVWEWHVWDHLCQNVNPAKDNYVTSIVQHPELLNINYNTSKDWMHVNGIDYNEQLDQIVFSSHNLNELYVIDHSTTTAEAEGHTGGNSGKGGDFLYRWGNPAAYQASGTNIFHVAHDAHWIPQDCPNAGYLVGFNNNGISNNQSCIDLINPPYDGYNYSITPGSAYLPSTYTFRQNCNGHSNNESNSQQLPNGNMLVCIAQAGSIYEISPTGALLWSKSASGMVAQAFRYSACYVNGALTVDATATPQSICDGESAQLNASASGGSIYTFSWVSSPAGFTSNIQNPVVSPDVTTIYTVTVSSDGCESSSSVTVFVGTPPTINVTASDEEICNGETVQLNASASGGTSYTYLWTSDPPGFNSILQNPVASPEVTTNYFVTVNSGGCSETDNVTVSVIPAPEVTAGSSSTEICQSEQVQLTATVPGGTSYTFLWYSNPPGFNSTLQNPVASPTVTTTYFVTASEGDCSKTDDVTITVNPVPSVTASSSTNEICIGESAQLNASASGGSSYTFSWTSDPEGFTSTLQNPVVTPTETTIYTVTVTSAGCTDSDALTIVVNSLPLTPTIAQVESTIVSSAIEGNQWFLEGDLIPGATSQVYIPLETGNYQVQITDQNGCLSSLSEVYFFQMVGIKDTSGKLPVHFSPNPTTGIIKSDGAIASRGNYALMIVDILGNIIFNAENPTDIDISDQENGVYFYVVHYESDENFTGKIVLIK